MQELKIGPQNPPPIEREEDANFAIVDFGEFQIFVEKEEDKDLINSTSDWMTKNGCNWNMVKHYKEAKLDPEKVQDFAMTQGLPKIEIMYHNEDLKHIEINEKGNFIDLRAAEDVTLKAGEWKLIDLGISVQLPQGFWAQIVPRSSTFKNYGLLVTNSFGVIDTSYCGEEDHWMLSVYATRDTEVHFNDRIAQFRLVADIPFAILETDHLDGENRGGIGSTGVE